MIIGHELNEFTSDKGNTDNPDSIGLILSFNQYVWILNHLTVMYARLADTPGFVGGQHHEILKEIRQYLIKQGISHKTTVGNDTVALMRAYQADQLHIFCPTINNKPVGNA